MANGPTSSDIQHVELKGGRKKRGRKEERKEGGREEERKGKEGRKGGRKEGRVKLYLGPSI